MDAACFPTPFLLPLPLLLYLANPLIPPAPLSKHLALSVVIALAPASILQWAALYLGPEGLKDGSGERDGRTDRQAAWGFSV